MQQFDVFAQLVASGNIATSARELGMPVTDVIDAMNALEDRLGFQLFMVEDGSVELTETGGKLVSALAELSLDGQEQWADGLMGTAPGPAAFDGIEDIGKTIRAAPRHFVPENPPGVPAGKPRTPLPAEPARTILLAAHPAIFGHFQEALTAFEEASPDIGISLRLKPVDAGQVPEMFEQQLADIVYFYALEEPPGFASRYAWSERISLFVGEGHPLTSKDMIGAKDLAAFPPIALAPGNMARTLTEEALARNGLTVGEPVLETDNLYEIMQQVQSRPCYFAAFGPMARDFGKMPGIVRLAYADGLPQVEVRQAVRPNIADDPALLALAEFLFR